MADPRNTRPNFTEAVETAMTKNKEEWRVQDLPEEERERMYDKLDPVEQELGELFSKRPRARHLHRPGQDLLHGGSGVVDTNGKNGKNNPGRNKNGNEQE